MNNTIRLNRLNHLIEVMRAVPKKKFFMGVWMQEEFFDTPLKIKIPDNFIEIDCQTAGCALGWAATDKEFIKAGLSVRADEMYGTVRYKDWQDDNAGSEFFGIDREQANDLFNAGTYDESTDEIKPHHVINKVKALIYLYGG